MPLFMALDLNANKITHAVIQRPRLAALTGLRFFAALYVVVFHTAIQSAPQYQAPKLWLIFLGHGDLAVPLFFILSGYVLTYNYADRWEHTSFMKSLGARFARIYPVYLLALLLQLPFWRTATTFRSLAVLFMVQSWTVRPSGLHRRMELSCLDTLCRMVLLPMFPSASLGLCQGKEQNGTPMADMPAHPRSWRTSGFNWGKGVLAINSCSDAAAATAGILPGDVIGSVFPEPFLFRVLRRDRHRFVGHIFAGS
jgi:hypothetical protein